ncbi:MAG: DUF1501 domain-containing protein [Henriciella sp.]|nr:DUF1501 domain-containing protein [Hyphomonadaceae bacterium]
MANISRRHVLAGLGTAGFASSLSTMTGLGLNNAWAADTGGYKAMVCIFLKGGMDGADTILPYDQASYNQLRSVRDGLFNSYNSTSGTSTRNRANLLKMNLDNAGSFGGREFAMPVELTPLHNMFEAGDLAVVGNVGPLIEPTTRAGMDNNSAILPKRLFSHNDQQSTWMSFGVEGVNRGWGGRFMDRVVASAPNQSRVFSAITTGSNDVFLAGETVSQFKVGTSGIREPSLYSNENILGRQDGDAAARDKIRAFLAKRDFSSRNIFEQDIAAATAKAVDNTEQFALAQENATPLTTIFGEDRVSRQMKSIAETIQIRQFLNVSRQMFYVTTGGYDTHSNQANTIGNLHAQLAAAISSFREAMIELGEWNNVVVFTASDFGRTTIDNGNGTDHGWGGHHFVAGGSVQGKRLYGDIPFADVDSNDFTKSRGRLIPTTSVEQYAATMGSWFGLDNSELQSALPNLRNFNTSDIGFMGTAST